MYIHTVIESTELLHIAKLKLPPLSKNAPFPPFHQLLATTILLPVSVNVLATLDISC